MAGGPIHQLGRDELGRVIDEARRALDSGDGSQAQLLVQALAARAEDSRHGANQLSMGAQRAPTRFDCQDGWERVESIVEIAEASAAEAERVARDLDSAVARKAAAAATAAARDARRIVDERNNAYTFHADPGFSFGEGWYVAASGLLAGIDIQVEPDKPHTCRVERFLADAGLADRIVPYRSRPRANKQLTEIVASAFRADPTSAQRVLRDAFLGASPIAPTITQWLDRALAAAPPKRKVLLWIRRAAHHPGRNTNHAELVTLARCIRDAGFVPVLFGDAVRDGAPPDGAVDLTLCWKAPVFQGDDMRRAQLQLFEHLRGAHSVVGQIGVTTAGMDGPALMGLPTLYLTQQPNVRMGRWVGAIPGYQEIVRAEGYLERIRETLCVWAS